MDISSLVTHFDALIDTRTGPIGRVVTSEKNPAAAHEFSFWAADTPAAALALDIGHIVVAFSEEAAVIGILDQPQRYGDLKTFLDDYFDYQGEEDIGAALASTRPEILVFTCRALASRHLRDDVRSRRPPRSGPVYYATPDAIRLALGKEGYSGTAIPVLLHRNGNAARDDAGEEIYEQTDDGTRRLVFQHTPVDVDSDYLLGPEAGHANWTGQSGLATKTSHALFVISSVFQKSPQSVAALMFNVKGPDLLWLDKAAYVSPEETETLAGRGVKMPTPLDRLMYEKMAISPAPVTDLRIFAPYKPGGEPHNEHGDQINLDGTFDHAALNTLRTARHESACVYPILWTLQEVLRYPQRVFEGADLDDKFFGFLSELREQKVHTVRGFEAKMREIMEHLNTEDDDHKKPQTWNDHHRFTILKANNRIGNLTRKCGGLLARNLVNYGELPRCDGSFADRELRVIDIANCNTTVQELLVSATIQRVWERAERAELGVEKVIIFVDELNKYAPGGGRGGLRDTLVDIAARGRHLNVVLFGAEQFRSKVDDEVVGNAATSFYGRIGDEEIISPSYRALTESTRAELLRVPKGTLLMRHAHIPVPVFGVFPRPPALAGSEAQKVYGASVHSGPEESIFRVLREMSQRADTREPTMAEVQSVLGARDLTSAQCDTVLDHVRRTYRQGSRMTPWQYFCNTINKNGI
ncbi:MAG: ATP-binding protein [Thermomicrobiales bacterium]